MTRGLKNNNPGNIRHNKDKFQGEVIPSQDKDFKQFMNMAYGYRAMFVTLGTYLIRDKKDTIEKIIKTWAPPNENHTDIYIKAVEKWSGVSRNQVLTITNGEEYIRIVAAMSRVENGYVALIADVQTGFDMQDKITR